MSKNKTSQDLLLRQAEERAPRYTLFTRLLKQLMLPVALISDFICYISASSEIFNEGPASYLPIALVGTAALDIPMSMAGELACRQLPKGPQALAPGSGAGPGLCGILYRLSLPADRPAGEAGHPKPSPLVRQMPAAGHHIRGLLLHLL